MADPSKPSMVKMNVRLPEELHTRLRQAAAQNRETIEKLARIAIENELESRKLSLIEAPVSWDALLAQRFVECLPTPAVIKDSEARIIWCNFAYEDLFDRPRTHLLSRKVDELQLFAEESEIRLRRDNQALQRSGSAEARHFWEPLTLLGRRTTLLFSAHRFVFRRQSPRTVFLGDISFDWSQVLSGFPRQTDSELIKRLQNSTVVPDVKELFQPFLQTCPTAIAIKQTDSCLQWCNHEYELLAQKPLSELQGKTTKEIFRISGTHPIVQNEHSVAHANVWMYAVEALPKRRARTSLRFPILGAHGRPSFIGVISAEFKQEDISFHDLRPRKVNNISKKKPAALLPLGSSKGRNPAKARET